MGTLRHGRGPGTGGKVSVTVLTNLLISAGFTVIYCILNPVFFCMRSFAEILTIK